MKIGLFLLPVWSVHLPPLGLSYLSATLRDEGHDVTVRDYNLEIYKDLYPNDTAEDGRWYELGGKKSLKYTDGDGDKIVEILGPYVSRVAKDILKQKYDLIGISLYSTSMKFTELVLRVIKSAAPDLKIVIGGPSSLRIDADFFLKHKLTDFVIYGEGEREFTNLINKLEKGENWKDISSLKYLGGTGKIIKNPRSTPMNPSEFKVPDFSDYNLNDYSYDAIPIMMSRGCVAACAFCDETFFWHRYRMGVIENLGRELRSAKDSYNPNFIYICDSLVNGDHELLEHLVDFVLDNNLEVSWGGNARFDMRLSLPLLKRMKKAGCLILTFGLESASEKVLKYMGKRITMDVVTEILDRCEAAGVKVSVNILVGFPGEEEEDFQQTLDFLKERKHQISNVNTGFGMDINENTSVYRQPKKYNVLLDENGSIAKHNGDWATADLSNTLEIRMERIDRLRKMLDEEEIIYRQGKKVFD